MAWRRRAVDPTIVADSVAAQDTVTQLVSAIRRVAREVPGAAGQIAAVCTGHDYGKPGKPKIDWDDPQAKDALVSALVNDADAVVAAFKNADLDERAASALALLALVAGQDVEPAAGSDGTGGRWRIAQKVAADRVVSAVDPDARHTRKSPEARRDGYRAHVAADPETGIITDEKLTRAAGQENSDPAVAGQFLAAEAGQQDPGPAAAGDPLAVGDEAGGDCGGDPLAWYGDSAYGTGDLRDAIEQAGHRAVIKPKPLQAPVEGGLTVDDFTVNQEAGTVTCPAGHTVRLSRTRIATFGAACRDCPCASGAPPARPAASSSCTGATTCCAPPARTGPPIPPGCARTTWLTGLTWSAPSPRWRPGGDAGEAPVPRGGPQPRLAQAPHRGTEPAQPDRQGPGPPRRHLGSGHLTSAQDAAPARRLPVRTGQPPGGRRRPAPARPPARPARNPA